MIKLRNILQEITLHHPKPFDFEDYDNTDVSGPSMEMMIDELIDEADSLIEKEVHPSIQHQARMEIRELWLWKIKMWGRE